MKKIVLVVAVIGLIALIAKKRSSDRAEWHGLTETQAREKLNDRFPDVIPEDKREVMTERIVSKMREKGRLTDDDQVDLTDTVDLAAEATTDDGVAAST